MKLTSLKALHLLAFFILGVTAPARADEQDSRAAVPESSAQNSAKNSILEVFKEEYRQRSASAKRDLAKKLLEQSRDTAGDVATRYVLLAEARDLAIEAGECGLAVEAIRGLAKHFKVEGSELEYDALSRLRRRAKTVVDHKVLAKAFLDLVDEAIRVEDFETARRSVSAGGTSARSAKELTLVNKAKQKAKEVSTRKRAFEKIARARKTLEKTPNDPDASATMGKYECFEKGNWDRGLVLLSKGSDSRLAALAKRDLEGPSEVGEVVTVGDKWWSVGDGLEWETRLRVRGRAVHWYEQASEEVSGLDKTKIKKRVAQYREDLLGPAELWKDVAVSGGTREGDVVTLAPAANGANSAALELPGEPVDAVSVRVRVNEADGGVNAGIQFQGKQRAMYLSRGSSFNIVHVDKDNPLLYVNDHVERIDSTQEALLTLVWEEGEYRFLIDGVEAKRVIAESESFGVVSIYVAHGPARFDRIRVRRKQ